LDEACNLLEAGFEYVTNMDDAKIFRKRKWQKYTLNLKSIFFFIEQLSIT
jgi:hypothetical protein